MSEYPFSLPPFKDTDRCTPTCERCTASATHYHDKAHEWLCHRHYLEVTAELNPRMPLSTIDRLLVVAEPWADMLVDGDKRWELRTTSTKVRGRIGIAKVRGRIGIAKVRGRIGIAKKGTGTIIGTVKLVDVHGPLTRAEIAPFEHLHRVPSSSTSTYSGPEGLYAWEVEGAVRFDSPVPYRHPEGAVIWVRLDPPVAVSP